MRKLFTSFVAQIQNFRFAPHPTAPRISEDEYYKGLFVNDPTWNAAKPNEDEAARWIEIQKFCQYILEMGDCNVEKIIDVGCGRGWLSEKLSDFGVVTGIEPVESVISYAKLLFSRPEFLAMKPDDFIANYPQRKFDLVVCSEVLEHVVKKTDFVKCLSDLLASNGYLIITTPRAELRKLWEKKYGNPPQPIEEWITTESLLTLLAEQGFRTIKSSTAFSEEIYQIHLAQKT